MLLGVLPVGALAGHGDVEAVQRAAEVSLGKQSRDLGGHRVAGDPRAGQPGFDIHDNLLVRGDRAKMSPQFTSECGQFLKRHVRADQMDVGTVGAVAGDRPVGEVGAAEAAGAVVVARQARQVPAEGFGPEAGQVPDPVEPARAHLEQPCPGRRVRGTVAVPQHRPHGLRAPDELGGQLGVPPTGWLRGKLVEVAVHCPVDLVMRLLDQRRVDVLEANLRGQVAHFLLAAVG